MAKTYIDGLGKQVTETARVATGHWAADYGTTVHVYGYDGLSMVYSGPNRREKAAETYGVEW